MRSTRSLQGWFGAGVALLTVVLVWVTVVVLRLEGAELDARTETARQEQLRLALWRMDSRLTPLLAREAARPYFEYSSYYPQERAYTRMLQPLDSREVLTASPLLTFASDVFPLHFQVSPDGTFRSPQVPRGSQAVLALQTCIGPETAETHGARLQELARHTGHATLSDALERSEARLECMDFVEPEPARDTLELGKRAQQAKQAASNVLDDAQVLVPEGLPDPFAGLPVVDVGPLVPVWMETGEDLLYVRRVDVGGERLVQGFEVDWPVLREQLLGEVRDLLPDARLLPVDGPSPDDGGLELAAVPAVLQPSFPVADAPEGMTPVRWALLLVWVAAGMAVGAAGHTVRASLALGERRSRFASAVTHELRTPLTTFRMYSEMLAEGMVTDAARRQEYLDTLRDESDRLARLVENVLSYAQLEDGRSRTKVERCTVDELLDGVRPTLERRAADAGMELAVDVDGAAGRSLETDRTAVGQVLFNLVDNAAKYAAGADDRRIEVGAAVRADELVLSVRDHGPGVDPRARRTIFDAFERRAPEVAPGVGLGLALSRALARELGGELSLDGSCADGGRFELRLPLRVAAPAQ